MDWKSLFLSPEGRIARQAFWLGWLAIVGVDVLVGWFPVIGQLVGLATIYALVCISSKRLHDMGKSGWLQVVPLVVAFVLPMVGLFITGGVAAIAALTSGGDAAAVAAMGGAGLFMLLGLAGVLVGFGFVLWIGCTAGQATENAYGPPPVTNVFAPASPPPV